MKKPGQSKSTRRLARGVQQVGTALCFTVATYALAETPVSGVNIDAERWAPTLSFGLNGHSSLIDMPAAQSAPDGELGLTTSYFAGTLRNTLSFQITPRLSGSFRYSVIDNFRTGGSLYDRSFDLSYQLITEGRYRPAVAIGLRDFIGTGVYSSEYIVATKHLAPGLAITGGIGWGRLGSYSGFANPLGFIDQSFETRPQRDFGKGGLIESVEWFRGDAAAFGGLSWAVSDKLTLVGEYASDDYTRAQLDGLFERRSPVNIGAQYQISEAAFLSGYYLYGDTLGASLSFALNPARPAVQGGLESAPVPVRPRISRDIAAARSLEPTRTPALRNMLAAALRDQGLRLNALELTAQTATLWLDNQTYAAEAQAIGRAARVMTVVLPASVDTFEIIPVIDGVATSRLTIDRDALARLEHSRDASQAIFDSIGRHDAAGLQPSRDAHLDGLYPRLSWGIGPYVSTALFDPDDPLRADVGLELSGRYDIAPGVFVSGALRQRVLGNRDEADRPSDSVLPRVRSESYLYDKADLTLPHLTLAYYAHPIENIYTRITAGYLEAQFGGVSTEVLWKPVSGKLAFGAELAYARQRDFEQDLGFRDYEVVTGHVSAYVDLGEGYLGQLDVGRYLAGDTGATVTLKREFENGWNVGAYATLTDVSFEDFGEGSFDKGITVSIPLSWFTGQPSRRNISQTLRPILRDGGARLFVQGRLYDRVRDYHDSALQDQIGRFWR